MLTTARWLPIFILPTLLACDWRQATGVVWEDIHAWKALGDRWASAYDRSGKRIAIYDLSYPDVRRQIELGLIGALEVRTKDLLAELERAALEGEVPAETTLVLRALRAAPPDEHLDRLPERWWNDLPWRPEFLARTGGRLNQAPRSFSLDDLDLASVSLDPARFQQLVGELEQERESPDDAPVLGKNFLRYFQFVRTPGGGYRVVWNPPQGPPITRPKKLVDLTTIHAGVVEKAIWQAVKTSINQVVELIPIPVASALFETAIGRFFHAREQSWNIHLDMLIEMARIAEDPVAGPLEELSTHERFNATRALTLSRASLAAIPTWVWRKPEDAWRKTGEDETKRAGHAIEWLEREQHVTERLDHRYALTSREGDRYLYILPSKAKLLGDEPALALDYSHADRVYRRRVFIEKLSTAVSFATQLIPIVGGTIKWVYGQLVESPMDRMKNWEGRLKIALIEGPLAQTRDWSHELRALDAQKVNRIELEQEAAREEIAARKRLLGL